MLISQLLSSLVERVIPPPDQGLFRSSLKAPVER